MLDSEIKLSREMADARMELNLAKAEAGRAEQRLKVIKEVAINKNADYEEEIQRLTVNVIEYNQINKADRERVEVLKENLNQEDITVDERSEIEQEIINIEERIDQRETQIEGTSLKSRIKIIFKKYGLTVIGVLSAVTTVIGVIVSNLSSGLSKMAKKLGEGLKELGAKVANILPCMVGAIASFIFKTAGEAIGFHAKNSWLLIVAVVVYFVEEFKKKKR